MPTPRAVWTRRMLDLLADGEWHDRAELLGVAASAVPPGRAHRQAERERRRSNGHDQPRVQGGQEQIIAAGARDIARRALHSLVRTRKVEHLDGRYRLPR